MKPIKNFFKTIFGLNTSAQIAPQEIKEEKLAPTQSPTPISDEAPKPKESPFFAGKKNTLFTSLGLQTAIQYYNQKYPQRGEIHSIYEVVRFRGVDPQVSKQLLDLIKSEDPKNNGPIKIILTLFEKVGTDQLPLHSHPFILTKDKLISMRDPLDKYSPTYDIITSSIKLKLVKPHNFNRSIQEDSSSCHFIALGILKDLTKEDLQKVADFGNDFKPLAKSLKYSQSDEYLAEMLDETSKIEKINKHGDTAQTYYEKYLVEDSNIGTRIAQKAEKFRNELKEIPSSSPKSAAAELLQRKENLHQNR